MLNFFTKTYQHLIYCGNALKSPILLLCRLCWGWLFMYAGWGKLMQIDNFAAVLEQMSFPLAHFQAYAVAYTEFIGGLCLLIGLACRLVSIPLIIVMITAYITVHYPQAWKFFENSQEFFAQTPFNFLLTALIMLAFGPGRFSLDYYIEKQLFSKAHEIPKHEH